MINLHLFTLLRFKLKRYEQKATFYVSAGDLRYRQLYKYFLYPHEKNARHSAMHCVDILQVIRIYVRIILQFI